MFAALLLPPTNAYQSSVISCVLISTYYFSMAAISSCQHRPIATAAFGNGKCDTSRLPITPPATPAALENRTEQHVTNQ